MEISEGRPRRLSKAISAEVRALLARGGISQMQVARSLNRAQSYVSKRLAGNAAFDTDELDIIGDLLGINGVDLILEVIRRGRMDEPANRRTRREPERMRSAVPEYADDPELEVAAHESREPKGLPAPEQP